MEPTQSVFSLRNYPITLRKSEEREEHQIVEWRIEGQVESPLLRLVERRQKAGETTQIPMAMNLQVQCVWFHKNQVSDLGR